MIVAAVAGTRRFCRGRVFARPAESARRPHRRHRLLALRLGGVEGGARVRSARRHARPFAAAVAFYPGCDPPDSALVTDTLILIGDAGDWTPDGRCARWRDTVHSTGHEVRMRCTRSTRWRRRTPMPATP